MSLFSFLKKNKESYYLVFNIGSGSVSGAIIKFTEKPGVDVIHYESSLIPFQQEISISKHLELMEKTLKNLAEKIRANGLRKINQNKNKKFTINNVYYIFSSPWCISQTKTIKVTETKAFRVTKSYLNKVIAKYENQFEAEIEEVGKIIEKKIIQIKTRNNPVNDIYNKLTKNLEISLFFTVVPEKILNTVENAVSKTFNIKNVWCHSLSLALFSDIRDLFPHHENFLQIDISEEMTDVSVVRDNVITNSISIPFGRNYFLRNISSILKVPEKIADSMIKIHCSNDNNELANLKLAVVMDMIAKSWLDKIITMLDNLKEEIYTIDSIFLIANHDITSFLKDKLQKEGFNVSLIKNEKIKINNMGNDISFKLALIFLDKLYKI